MTFIIDPATLETARLEAERRETSVKEMVADYVASVAHTAQRSAHPGNLIRLMNEGVPGHIDRPMTREEIYAERTWRQS